MLNDDFRIAKIQKTLRWFEEDVPLLNMRVKDLSSESQQSARNFLAAVLAQTRAELERLTRERPVENTESDAAPCEPAD